MNLSLGFSPCPNDTFMFDGLVNEKLDLDGLSFQPVLADVEALNQKAFAGELDITKLSYHAYAYVMEEYQLLTAGSALGNNCGPLLIAKKPMSLQEIEQASIAIPGKYTTANFLLSLAYPTSIHKTEMIFSDIEAAVLNEKVDAGLIIHENRFTYMDRGLVKIMDLGEYWETQTQMPIPLGGIAIRRSLPADIKQKVNHLLRKSVQLAFAAPAQTMDYVSQYAQEMNPEVMRKHIELYVNDYSIDLGEKGRKAVTYLYNTAIEKGILNPFNHDLFINLGI